VVREIGRGACSVVYEAEHVDLGRRVALKVLSEGRSRSEEFAARFRREARALSKLEHPGLVKVHDFGQADDGRLFCAMELLEGETLEDRIQREKVLDVRVALELADKVLCALDAAHAEGVIHRDVKPSNLFVTAKGELKILDFGLAKSPESLVGSSFATTRTGFTLFGTPEYMAPEQAAAGQVDVRADLYALGCILYELVTGKLPFPGESAVAILAAKVKGSPVRPREAAPERGIPESVDALVMRALARHPSVRFQSAAEMREAIGQAAKAAAPPRRRLSKKVVACASAAAAVVVLVGAVFAARGRAMPWPRGPVAGEQVAAAPSPQDDEAPMEELDAGEDGDMVDDTPSGMLANAAAAPAPASASASASEPASASASASEPASASVSASASASASDPASASVSALAAGAALASGSALAAAPALATVPALAAAPTAAKAKVAVASHVSRPPVRSKPRKRVGSEPAAAGSTRHAAAPSAAPKKAIAKAGKPAEPGKHAAASSKHSAASNKRAGHGAEPERASGDTKQGSQKTASKGDKAHHQKKSRVAKAE